LKIENKTKSTRHFTPEFLSQTETLWWWCEVVKRSYRQKKSAWLHTSLILSYRTVDSNDRSVRKDKSYHSRRWGPSVGT